MTFVHVHLPTLLRFEITRLLEINAHSLFSRWFSESGKLVQRLFSHINEIAMDEGCFVVVLIGTAPWDPRKRSRIRL